MKIADVTKLFSPREAVQPLAVRVAELLAEHRNLLAERAKLLTLPPPVAEILADVNRQIDAIAERYAADHGARILCAVAGRVETEPGRLAIAGVREGSLHDAFPGPLMLRDLVALAPSAVGDGLAAILRSVPYEAGPPLAERPALIEQVDARLAAVEREHTSLADEARESGIDVPLMAGERARRIQAAQRAADARAFNAANATAIRLGRVAPMAESRE